MAEEKKVKWLPLESNPEAMNKYLEKIGVQGAECHEVYGFEDELLDFVPKPHLALVFCSPYPKAKEIMEPLYNDIEQGNVQVDRNIFFMKQKISNACGTFALFHGLAQHVNTIKLVENGPFAKWYNVAKTLDVNTRSKSLEENVELAGAHESIATSGETRADVENVEYHFICYTNVGDTLYEFDSCRSNARRIGPTTQDTLLKDAGKECKKLMDQLGNIGFSAIAVVVTFFAKQDTQDPIRIRHFIQLLCDPLTRNEMTEMIEDFVPFIKYKEVSPFRHIHRAFPESIDMKNAIINRVGFNLIS